VYSEYVVLFRPLRLFLWGRGDLKRNSLQKLRLNADPAVFDSGQVGTVGTRPQNPCVEMSRVGCCYSGQVGTTLTDLAPSMALASRRAEPIP
jgi:hypothetical protein